MSRAFRTRTWPVLFIGIVSLLALLFLPGLVALRKTGSIYVEIRRTQDAHRETQRLLSDIERRVYLVSIIVREALLDASNTNRAIYKNGFERNRREIYQQLATMKEKTVTDSRISMPKLEQELEGYFNAIQPVFEWTPAQRTARATYFLREQQRPRRQSIIEIAEEISRLTESAYSKQLDLVNQSQMKFSEDIRRVIVAAFLIGALIAGITISRMLTLEERAERHRKKTERAEEELRNLSTKLMHAQEEERKTISRELHDEVGQMLTGVRMGLGVLERIRENQNGFLEQITEIKSLAEQALRSVRDLAVGLRPSVLDLGLVPAVQWQARRFSKYSGVSTTVHPDGNIQDVPEDYRTCIYRVVQECLTNAVKHSGAKIVRVEIRQSNRVLEVAVKDDGAGFVLSEVAHGGGLGLIGMEERVRELGGTFRVESEPSIGTEVVVRLPLLKNKN